MGSCVSSEFRTITLTTVLNTTQFLYLDLFNICPSPHLLILVLHCLWYLYFQYTSTKSAFSAQPFIMASHASGLPNTDQVRAAAAAVAHALKGKQHYAVIGGAACAVLGSHRDTADVDFVVPKGETKAARTLLKTEQAKFTVESKTNHTYYLSHPQVEVEILAPPGLFKEEFSASTPTITVNDVRLLKPTLILNAKCRSILGRANDSKKATDSQDILFLLAWCAHNRMRPTAAEVPNASKDFVGWFISTFGGADAWAHAGYDVSKGTWSA
ncbi:hypothetical protein QBC46DRAFT_282939 [Diplogelasinospora grovesii]|uniref:Uncharacterized protein n=1 Tax=Diplogelasinospora grovesii TaxID=303347 RepID=A0AAN6ND18_9PEZI|nr:hypothetical protein QBC46DRAFT_282939 [Diplogelasinospora grovesii]